MRVAIGFVFSFIFCSFLLVPVSAFSAETDYTRSALYQSLSYNAAKGDMNTVLSVIDTTLQNKKTDYTALNTLAAWLSDNSYAQVDAGKVFSDYLLKLYDVDYQLGQLYKAQSGDKSTTYRQATLDSFKALLTYEVMAVADAQRCNDPSVRGVVANNLGPRYQNINYAYKFLNENEISLAWYFAMQVEAQKADRAFNIHLCLQGEKAAQDPDNYNPVDITPAAWADIRNTVRSKYTDYWKGRYSEALRAAPVAAEAP